MDALSAVAGHYLGLAHGTRARFPLANACHTGMADTEAYVAIRVLYPIAGRCSAAATSEAPQLAATVEDGRGSHLCRIRFIVVIHGNGNITLAIGHDRPKLIMLPNDSIRVRVPLFYV